MVRLESIAKSFGGRNVIADFSLEIGAGEVFILLGRSGCGKTTLLRLIAGFERPDSGRIFIAGEDMSSLPMEKRPAGFIFQNHALFPHMNVYDNIAVGPRIRKTSEREIAKRIDELLEVTRLGDLRHAFPGQLSGGESQRVALARAIINRPKVLLLDEPLSAIDPSLRQNLRAELVALQKTFGVTFLFVTHDQEEAMSLATHMGVLENGRLLQVGTPVQLYEHPNCPFVARFLGDINETAKLQPSSSRAESDGKTYFIRPEKMRISAAKPDSLECLEGVVVDHAFFGDHTKYQVVLSGEIVHVLTHDAKLFENGDRVWVSFHSDDVLVFDEAQ